MFKDRNQSLRDHYTRSTRNDRDKPRVEKTSEPLKQPFVTLPGKQS